MRQHTKVLFTRTNVEQVTVTEYDGNESLVITASGEDQVGLVEKLSRQITAAACNIEESRMVTLGGRFAVIMRATGASSALVKLEGQLASIGQQFGLSINHCRPGNRARAPVAIPYQVEVVALDHPGIVHSLARFFSERGINIEEVQTNTYPAPHTGAPMFSVSMMVGIPADAQIAALRDEFVDYCDELNLDAVLEVVRG